MPATKTQPTDEHARWRAARTEERARLMQRLQSIAAFWAQEEEHYGAGRALTKGDCVAMLDLSVTLTKLAAETTSFAFKTCPTSHFDKLP